MNNTGLATVQEMLNHLEAKYNENPGILKLLVTREMKQELELLASKMEARKKEIFFSSGIVFPTYDFHSKDNINDVEIEDENKLNSLGDQVQDLQTNNPIPKVFDLLPERDYGEDTTIEKGDEFKGNRQNIEHDEEVGFTRNIQCGNLTKSLPKWSSVQGVMLKSSMVVREVGSGAVQVFDERFVRKDEDPTITEPIFEFIESDDTFGFRLLLMDKYDLEGRKLKGSSNFDTKGEIGNYIGLQEILIYNIISGGTNLGLGSILQDSWRVLPTHASIQSKFFDPGIVFNNVEMSNKNRILFMFQRISHDHNFIKFAFDMDVKTSQRCQLSTIQFLVGQRGRRLVMSVVSQLEDDHFYLEDFTDVVEGEVTTRVFTENIIIVAEGEMLYEGIFQIITCYFSPLENKYKSLKVLAGHNFFDCSTLTKEETPRLSNLKKRAANDMPTILSDISLDNEHIMKKLKTIFNGFRNVKIVLSLIVFMEDFCSHPCNLSFHSFSSLRLQIGELGQMIEAHFRLKEQSKFLFILGLDNLLSSLFDPWGQGSSEGGRNVMRRREANNEGYKDEVRVKEHGEVELFCTNATNCSMEDCKSEVKKEVTAGIYGALLKCKSKLKLMLETTSSTLGRTQWKDKQPLICSFEILDKNTLSRQWQKTHKKREQKADKKRNEREIWMEANVCMKIQPSQTSLALERNLKLVVAYYGPYKVKGMFGLVAYRLQLPEKMRRKGITASDTKKMSIDDQLKIYHVVVLSKRMVKYKIQSVTQLLTQWNKLGNENTILEDYTVLKSQFLNFDPWGQGSSDRGSIVTIKGEKRGNLGN
ncbi:hypothetical protein GQ457_01G018520 [Hibiscus cannabinus]